VSEILNLGISRLATELRRRQVSPVEVVEAALARIEEVDKTLRSFITVTKEAALSAARIAENEITQGAYRGPLHGIPVAVKDVIDSAGVRTTKGSRIFADSVPATDADVVARLKSAGAIVIGKNNLHEFALGSTTANPFYGACRNPRNPDHVPGGSSGGSAAAVAAHLCFGSIGTDTAGSIRSPASQCGVVGLKPTAGMVSLAGVFPVSPSLDHVGPLARSTTDAALILQAIAQPRVDWLAEIDRGLQDVKVGVPTSFFFDDVDEEVEERVCEAITVLAGIGASVGPLLWPHAQVTADAVFTIAGFESAQVHRSWLQSRPDDYSTELRARLEQAARIKPNEYERAKSRVDGLRKDFLAAMNDIDVMAAPTNPVVAPRCGQTHVVIGGREWPVAVVMPRLGAPANLTGCPAISVPCGTARSGLPVGLQLVGRPFGEAALLRVARAYENAVKWRDLQ
jgi:aspartyl-tRNA(Asn)/glutamyl-tRNA(Gln) amidotransferase subunit A